MKYDDDDNGDNNKEKVTDTNILELNASMLSYDDLLAFVKAQFLSTETPWKLTFESHAYFDMSLYDNKLINGVRVFKELQVFNNLSWIVSYAGVQATEIYFHTFQTRFHPRTTFLISSKFWKTCTFASE